MKSTIYVLNKSDMLKRRTDTNECELKFPKYLTVVFKSVTGELGFKENQLGVDYMSKYLLKTILWDHNKQVFIDLCTKTDIVNYSNKINGLTFFDNNFNVIKLKEQVQLIESINKKNAIYLRHERSVIEVPSSSVLNYFVDRKISIKDIIDLKEKFERLIIWDWGEFGLYFHILSDDFHKEICLIESFCENLDIEILIKDNEDEVPSW